MGYIISLSLSASLSLSLSPILDVECSVLDYGLTIPLALAVTFRAIDYGRRVVCPVLPPSLPLPLPLPLNLPLPAVAAAAIFSCISIIVIALRVQIVQQSVVSVLPVGLAVQLCIKVAPQNNPNARHILTNVCPLYIRRTTWVFGISFRFWVFCFFGF